MNTTSPFQTGVSVYRCVIQFRNSQSQAASSSIYPSTGFDLSFECFLATLSSICLIHGFLIIKHCTNHTGASDVSSFQPYTKQGGGRLGTEAELSRTEPAKVRIIISCYTAGRTQYPNCVLRR